MPLIHEAEAQISFEVQFTPTLRSNFAEEQGVFASPGDPIRLVLKQGPQVLGVELQGDRFNRKQLTGVEQFTEFKAVAVALIACSAFCGSLIWKASVMREE